MVRQAGSTPLVALDAVVLNVERAGDDPAKARPSEIAALLLVGGKLDDTTSWRRVPERDESPDVDTGSDSAPEMPDFPNLAPELDVVIGERIVIGHDLSDKLAAIKMECERGGFDWQIPPHLDVALLAQVLRPNLPGGSLDEIAQWAEIERDAERSAFGDARTAGRIFLELVPRLRELGVRTLGDAEQACRGLTASRQPNVLGLLSNIDAAVRSLGEKLPRIDSYSYLHRVGDVMSPVKFIGRDSTVGLAVRRLEHERVSSLFVAPSGREDATFKPQDLGIITERDVLRAVADHGTASLFMPVNGIVSAPLLTITADEFIYRAIGRMRRLKIRHLGVVDESGRVCGAISARDLLRLRGDDVGGLGDEIDEAEDAAALGRAWARVSPVAERLLDEGTSGAAIAVVISREVGALTRRAAMLARKRMQADGLGPPPSAYALVVLGSAGRGESLLAPDQNHALLFTAGEPGSDADSWFATFSEHVADTLRQAGLRYAASGAGAQEAVWRGSIATWRERVRGWIAQDGADHLAGPDLFFDMRAVHGDFTIADTVRADAFEAAKGNADFAARLVQAGSPHVAMMERLRTRLRPDQIDVKARVLAPVAALARAFSVRQGVMERGTVERLLMAEALEAAPSAEVHALVQAYEHGLELVLRAQLQDIARGAAPSNMVRAGSLPREQRANLTRAISAAAGADRLIAASSATN